VVTLGGRKMAKLENFYKSLGSRVRAERKKLGLTQEELAEKVDLTGNFLGHIERGTKKASLDTMKKLADALEIPMENLFAEVKYIPKKEDLLLKKIVSAVRDKEPAEKKLLLKLAKLVLKKK